jgi:1,4-alpha-glucan branching enzyme
MVADGRTGIRVIEVRAVAPRRDRSGVPSAQYEVTFRIPSRPEIRSICVVGEFNDWDVDATPMELDGDDFTSTILLDAGRRYRFKYVVNDESWENDWAADEYEHNDFGGDDSVIDLHAGRH